MDALRRDSVDQFTAIADEDLQVAEMCLHASPPARHMAAFHAQQAAEKYLKAWLVALGEDEPPLTHNLVELGRLLVAHGAPALDRSVLEFLTTFAVAPRYGLEHPGLDEAQRAFADAQTVVAQARAALEQLGGLSDAASEGESPT